MSRILLAVAISAAVVFGFVLVFFTDDHVQRLVFLAVISPMVVAAAISLMRPRSTN